MTEERWIYHAPPSADRIFVPCTAGNNAFTDCMVSAVKGKVRITGYAEMDFTIEECVKLAAALVNTAEQL